MSSFQLCDRLYEAVVVDIALALEVEFYVPAGVGFDVDLPGILRDDLAVRRVDRDGSLQSIPQVAPLVGQLPGT